MSSHTVRNDIKIGEVAYRKVRRIYIILIHFSLPADIRHCNRCLHSSLTSLFRVHITFPQLTTGSVYVAAHFSSNSNINP